MKRVVSALKKRCNVDDLGGRVVFTSRTECSILDLAEFTHETWSELTDSFSNLRIGVVSDPLSLGGFAIHLKLQSSRWASVVALVLACMAAIVAHCLRIKLD
jgi:hypothetical protein